MTKCLQPSGPQQAVTHRIPEATADRAVPAEAAAQEADQAEGMYPQMEAPEQLPWRKLRFRWPKHL